MTEEQISRLRQKYRPLGIMRAGRELLLPPEDALHLLRDLAEMGIVVIGCELWQYVDRNKGWIKELPGAGAGVEHDRYESITAMEAAAFLEDFLVKNLSPEVDFVSFISRDVDIDEWFA